jgi:predicted house-cleaning noncanonical NTP pyrophosphatase (MazG superfamily)
MLKFAFNKLVRDKIVDQQIASGSKPKYRTLDKDEHIRHLVEKIIEEVKEIVAGPPGKAASEIADVQQALDDLKEQFGVTDEDIAREQKRKNGKAGAFKKGLFVEHVEVDENDPWVNYYRQNADRYPEIT